MSQAAATRKYALLRISAPGQAVRTVVFDTQDLSIGRSPENDVSIEHCEISRRHAVLSRSQGACIVEDMGTSNGTCVNGEPVRRARIEPGDIVGVADVEVLYLVETRSPASLGTPVEYASQLKSLSMPAGQTGDGDATILGLMDPAPDSEDEFRVGPASDFEYDLHDMGLGSAAPRDLDAELEDFGEDALEELAVEEPRGPTTAPPARPAQDPRPAGRPASPAPARAPAPAPAAWDLEELEAPGPLSLHIELDGLTPELRRTVETLIGKTLSLPALRIRFKADDL